MADSPRAKPDLSFISDARPRVATAQSLWPLMGGVLGALALGVVVFLQLSNNRASVETARLAAAQVGQQAPQPAPVVVQADPVMPPLVSPDLRYEPPLVDLAPPPPPPPGPTQSEIDRLRAPALIVDLGEYRAPDSIVAAPPGSALDPRSVAAAVSAPPSSLVNGQSSAAGALNPDESFAQRLGVGDPGKPALAKPMISPSMTVVEGTLIPAVLETALNSDLPGYARAVVSRDVRGFNGANVLIPRGTRLIGQYRSGVALGQSRAFVIWTRLIRPDGATVELASPATDALGRGGLDGEVDRHFLQRFGGAILLTLLNVGASAVTDASDTNIVIATTRAGADSAGVALASDLNIAPTVKVPQGSPVRVFVSQDIDFSNVGAVVVAPSTGDSSP